MHNVLIACFGDDQSTARIQQLAASSHVIAVAMDFGGAMALGAMRDLALAAGARRCHALDVREEFTRDVLLPALREGRFADPAHAFEQLAPAFATRKLHAVAELEQAPMRAPERVVVLPRPLPQVVASAWQLDIAFEDGIPVAINGIRMALTELMDSIETITGERALYVLQREMTRSREHQLA